MEPINPCMINPIQAFNVFSITQADELGKEKIKEKVRAQFENVEQKYMIFSYDERYIELRKRNTNIEGWWFIFDHFLSMSFAHDEEDLQMRIEVINHSGYKVVTVFDTTKDFESQWKVLEEELWH